jgi:hypothetical protein
MKKLFVTAILFSAFTMAHGQELMSKKGTPILPEPKDWSIGFQADPLLKYFGNLFNKDQNNNTILGPQTPLTLVGLYVKDERTSYRAKIRLGFGSSTTNNLVDDDAYTGPLPSAKTTDTWKSTYVNVGIGVGYQKNRGKGRLRGIYGVEAGVGFGSTSDSYTYGNAFSASNSDPTSTTDWSTVDTAGNFLSGPVSTRTKEVKNPTKFNFYLNGFLGAEYFFAPKMSLSAEYGWGLMFETEGERETFIVSNDGGAGRETSSRNAKSSDFSLDVRDAGSITLHLYF